MKWGFMESWKHNVKNLRTYNHRMLESYMKQSLWKHIVIRFQKEIVLIAIPSCYIAGM